MSRVSRLKKWDSESFFRRKVKDQWNVINSWPIGKAIIVENGGSLMKTSDRVTIQERAKLYCAGIQLLCINLLH